MKIRTLLSPLNVEELYFTKKTTVVIDVLRATTTIVTALNNGAKEIIPVSSIEFAMKVSGGGQMLLGGERNAEKIDGFTLGNSPLEYTKEAIEGKSIVLFTTNGSKALVRAKFSANLFVGSFSNASSAVKKVLQTKEDLEILCSGNYGMYCLEDSICAGMMIEQILEVKADVDLDDASNTCLILYKKYKHNLKKMLSETDHGKNLIAKGFESDIAFAVEEDACNIVPYFKEGVVKI
ncbi:MAG: 2-phosphosulfolactate phosphatase [Ignavibacteriae bacterium]|nr:2-phosphosulfolactate phosphatase [Ignavibacteriota bacterium]